MSLTGGAYDRPEVRTVINPITALEDVQTISLVESAKDMQVQRYVANSVSNNSLVWNINIPSQVVIDRSFLLEVPFTFTFSGSAGSGSIYAAGADAVRCLPVQQLIQNATLSINGQSTSINLNQLIYGAWALMGDNEKALFNGSGFQDNYTEYGTSANVNNNPLGTYAVCGYGAQLSRGSLNGSFTVVSNTTTSCTITGTLYENLTLLSPLLAGPNADLQKGLYGVNTLSLTLSLANSSTFTPFWSHYVSGTSTTITSSSLTIGANTTLSVKTFTPPYYPSPEKSFLYSYFQMTPYVTNGGSLASAASTTLTSNVISVDVVPSKILVWARIAESARTYSTPDTFCAITNLSVTYNNRSSIMSNLSQYNLFEMARNNGVNMSWIEFSKYKGSVIAIDVGKDIGVNPDQSPGVCSKVQFSVQATFTNQAAATLAAVSLYVIPVLPGYCRIGGGTCSFGVGLLTPEEAMASRPNRYNIAAYQKAMSQSSLFSAHGGNFLDDLWSGVKSTAKVLAPEAAKFAFKAVTGMGTATNLGLGVIGGYKHKATRKKKSKSKKRSKSRRKMRGRGAEDVETLSNNDLEQRLRGCGLEDSESEESSTDSE